jgi:hypothetical protein
MGENLLTRVQLKTDTMAIKNFTEWNNLGEVHFCGKSQNTP